jgi:hypothetical protein
MKVTLSKAKGGFPPEFTLVKTREAMTDRLMIREDV